MNSGPRAGDHALALPANHLTVFVLMVFCLRSIEMTPSQVDIVEAFAASSLARVLGSLRSRRAVSVSSSSD